MCDEATVLLISIGVAYHKKVTWFMRFGYERVARVWVLIELGYAYNRLNWPMLYAYASFVCSLACMYCRSAIPTLYIYIAIIDVVWMNPGLGSSIV